MCKDSSIYVAGHTGLLGSAMIRALDRGRYGNIVIASRDFDLTDSGKVSRLFNLNKPEYVFMAAAKVGNIAENIKYPAEFMSENLLIQYSIMQAAYEVGVKKLLFFGANCCYPRKCPQPMREEYLMTGPLEPTNRAYAMAKLAGIEMCRSFNLQYGANFIVAIPASMYGENNHFEHGRAHVLPDMIKKFHNAMVSDMPEVVLWGDGSPRREFIYADDAADASIFLMDNFSPSKEEIGRGDVLINVGTGIDYSIVELADIVRAVVGYKGKIVWDTSKPNGMPRKLLDSNRLRTMGWQPKVDILEGIRRTYQWYIRDIKQI
jgi:GDP-L-fucose synthase